LVCSIHNHAGALNETCRSGIYPLLLLH
jgi:hypothetical protein